MSGLGSANRDMVDGEPPLLVDRQGVPMHRSVDSDSSKAARLRAIVGVSMAPTSGFVLVLAVAILALVRSAYLRSVPASTA